MKAILYKDWRVMRRQAVMPVMLLWIISISLFIRNASAASLGVTMVCGMYPYLTITYDENAHYLRFALSQPLSRRDYVWSKYLPNLMLTMFLLIYQLILLLPSVFKFGVNKTRLVYMAIVFGGGVGMQYSKQIMATVSAWEQALSSLPKALAGVGGFALLALIMAGSICLSIRFVNQKDY